jgi:uncharacterized protein (DUF1330 family)
MTPEQKIQIDAASEAIRGYGVWNYDGPDRAAGHALKDAGWKFYRRGFDNDDTFESPDKKVRASIIEFPSQSRVHVSFRDDSGKYIDESAQDFHTKSAIHRFLTHPITMGVIFLSLAAGFWAAFIMFTKWLIK